MRSVATIDKPEFINVTPYNPLISRCEVKVLYVGENRNRSYITKAVAAEMANSLPGCPIVGWFKEEKDDYADHGQVVTLDGDGIHFEVKTKPYGFIAPDAKIWFQKFNDTDEFGNVIEREYLMTEGFLWTGQYEEAQRVINEGRPQSMELDEETLSGKWATNPNSGIEFFIINDAIFSKLAILGTDVEPCFEGAEVTAPKLSSSFTLDDEFKTTLFTMMEQLKGALELSEGGLNTYMRTKQQMIDGNVALSDMTEDERGLFTLEEVTEMEGVEREAKRSVVLSSLEDGSATVADLNDDQLGLFEEGELAKYEVTDAGDGEGDEDEADALEAAVEEEPPAEEPEVVVDPEPTVEEQFAALQTAHEELQTKFTELETEATSLREFKDTVENSQKDELIGSFYMLSDADKADVIANKSNYSLEQIEEKLAVICVRNKVSFDRNETVETPVEAPGNPITTFNLDDAVVVVPGFVQALRETTAG